MYKAETTLGLIGSILSAVFAFLILVGSALAILFFSTFEPVVHRLFDTYVWNWGWTYDTASGFVIPAIAICAGVAVILASVSCILGFLGTAKLRRDDKSGGVLLIVGGAIAFITFFEFIPFVLMLVGGIMAVSRRKSVDPSAQQPSA